MVPTALKRKTPYHALKAFSMTILRLGPLKSLLTLSSWQHEPQSTAACSGFSEQVKLILPFTFACIFPDWESANLLFYSFSSIISFIVRIPLIIQCLQPYSPSIAHPPLFQLSSTFFIVFHNQNSLYIRLSALYFPWLDYKVHENWDLSCFHIESQCPEKSKTHNTELTSIYNLAE